MLDFTINTYRNLLNELISARYTFSRYDEFIQKSFGNVILLRHDVDKLPLNSLVFAKIQSSLGLKGTYYFRMVPQSFNQRIIYEIASLGHEIGYHYETMDTSNGIADKAWDEFRSHLDTFRRIVPVLTICMHGSPYSKYNNKDLWEKYNYRSLGLIGEPYLDTDFNRVGYLSDTGRRWNGGSFSVRDKVQSNFNFNFGSTFEIIDSINLLPSQVMFTFHPQRWSDNRVLWTKEIVTQNAKNVIKYFIVQLRDNKNA